MVGRVVELTTTGLAVHKRRGFLAVDSGEAEAGRVGLDEIEAVLVSSPGVTWSSAALAELATRQTPVMIVGSRFTPVAVVLPLDGHHAQATRFRAQAAASLPLRKQLWAGLVRAKIGAQAAALDRIGAPSERLRRLRGEVRSGDPDNREGIAAQAYWPLLMGPAFRRDRDAHGVNAMLNYGYAVLRAAAARAVVAAGLHPSRSVHHSSEGDALAFADDLMEPFRPTIDITVRSLAQQGVADVADARARLIDCLSADFACAHGLSPLTQTLLRLAQSMATSCEQRSARLTLPRELLPIAIENA